MHSYVLSYEFLLIIYKLRRSGVLNEQVLCYDELRLCEWFIRIIRVSEWFSNIWFSIGADAVGRFYGIFALIQNPNYMS